MDIDLTNKEAKILVDLLALHTPSGGGSAIRALWVRMRDAFGIDGATDYYKVLDELIEDHISSYEGASKPPVDAAIEDMTARYLRVAATMDPYYTNGDDQ